MPPGRSPIYKRPLARVSLDEALDAMPEDAIERGQTLRDMPAFRVEGKSAGLWVATGVGAETEVQLNGRKLKDYRCDCAEFQRKETCQHFAALLAVVHLRKAPRVAKKSPARRQIISTKRLIDSLDESQLRDFVTAYAKTHKDFALDLKLRFAQELPIAKRFEQVVKNLLRRTGADFSSKQAKRINEALAQFSRQREEWLANKAYLDIFELNTTLVPKLVVLIGKSERINVDLPEYITTCIIELEQVVARNPPPVIVERIEAWLNKELERGAYFRNEVDLPLYKLMSTIGSSAQEVEELIKRMVDTYGSSTSRIGALMQLYYRTERNDDAERLLIEHLDQPELVQAALQEELLKQNYRRAAKLAEAALKQQSGADDRLLLQRFLIGLALPAGQPALLIEHAPALVKATGSLSELLHITEQHDADVEQQTLQNILDKLPSLDVRSDQRDLLHIDLLIRLDYINEAEDLLYRASSDTLIATYLPKLVGKLSTEDLGLLLETKVREHLQDRFGKAPAEWVANLLDEVARRSRTDLTTTLVARLRQEYKQRPALIDALDAALL